MFRKIYRQTKTVKNVRKMRRHLELWVTLLFLLSEWNHSDISLALLLLSLENLIT